MIFHLFPALLLLVLVGCEQKYENFMTLNRHVIINQTKIEAGKYFVEADLISNQSPQLKLKIYTYKLGSNSRENQSENSEIISKKNDTPRPKGRGLMILRRSIPAGIALLG